jgi:DNA-binding transcriptional ArsR family regulator
MIRLQLGVVDLASVRFAYSPLQEAVLSLWAWRDPARYPLHQDWIARNAHLISEPDRALLTSLVGSRGYLPDFLCPRPASPEIRFPDALEAVRATPAATITADVLAANVPREGHAGPGRPTAVVARAEETPASLVSDVCDALQRYWDDLLSAHWPRMRQVLDADIQYRSRQIVTGGAQALFSDLDSALRWDGDTLHIDSHHETREVPVAGPGLPLSPSLFTRYMITVVDNELPPHLTYPARGRAELWEPGRTEARAYLAELIGATRASLLTSLTEPRSTSDLATTHGMSPATVSQHLHVLLRNDLVDRNRRGRSVLYRRTILGDHVVEGRPA